VAAAAGNGGADGGCPHAALKLPTLCRPDTIQEVTMTPAPSPRGRATIAVLLLLLPLAAAAQPAPPPPPVTATPPGSRPPASPSPASPPTASPPTAQAAADARLRALQTELHITDAQMPQWNAFAQAMRDNATRTDALFRDRAKTVSTMTALDNMKSYAQIARAYADDTEALAEAFAPLYAALNEQQKQTIDGLFREQAAKNASAAPGKP
jgi:hypothetical protein